MKKNENWWIDFLIENNRDFEKYYIKLYDKLYKRFEVEYINIDGIESKSEFLEDLNYEIVEANHNMKFNYSISEFAEKEEERLKGLFAFFEKEMQKLYFTQDKSKQNIDKLWFKTGVSLAKGEMDTYWVTNDNGKAKSNDISAREICEKLNLIGCEKYVLASLNGYKTTNKNGDKNIFNSLRKLNIIDSYCKTNSIPFSLKFKTQFEKALDDIRKNM